MGLVYHCNIFSVYFFSFQIFACCLIATRRDGLWTPWSPWSPPQTGTSASAFRDFSSSSCFLLFQIFAFCLIAPQREGEASLARSPRRLIERAARGDTQLLPCYNNQHWKSKNDLPCQNNEQWNSNRFDFFGRYPIMAPLSHRKLHLSVVNHKTLFCKSGIFFRASMQLYPCAIK